MLGRVHTHAHTKAHIHVHWQQILQFPCFRLFLAVVWMHISAGLLDESEGFMYTNKNRTCLHVDSV